MFTPSPKTTKKTSTQPVIAKKTVPIKPSAVAQLAQLLSDQVLEMILPKDILSHHIQGEKNSLSNKVKFINPFLPIHPAPISPEYISAVMTALSEVKRLKISFRPHNEEFGHLHENVMTREIAPLGLVQNATNTLLVYRQKNNSEVHMLSLSRLLSVEVLRGFTYPTNFVLKTWLNDCFLAKNGKAIRLIFCIERSVGEFLFDTPLSADQQIFVKKKKLEVHATVEDTPILDHWLGSFGEQISKVRKERIV